MAHRTFRWAIFIAGQERHCFLATISTERWMTPLTAPLKLLIVALCPFPTHSKQRAMTSTVQDGCATHVPDQPLGPPKSFYKQASLGVPCCADSCSHLPAARLDPLHAQSNYAVVRGSVLDPQHHRCRVRTFISHPPSTGAEREVVPNTTGLYEIAGLQPGRIHSRWTARASPSKQRLTWKSASRQRSISSCV